MTVDSSDGGVNESLSLSLSLSHTHTHTHTHTHNTHTHTHTHSLTLSHGGRRYLYIHMYDVCSLFLQVSIPVLTVLVKRPVWPVIVAKVQR